MLKLSCLKAEVLGSGKNFISGFMDQSKSFDTMKPYNLGMLTHGIMKNTKRSGSCARTTQDDTYQGGTIGIVIQISND